MSASITYKDTLRYFMSNSDPDQIILFIVENCSPNKVYFVHNLTFEAFALMK